MALCDRLWRYIEEPAGEDHEARGLRRLLFTVSTGIGCAQTFSLALTLTAAGEVMLNVATALTMVATGIGLAYLLLRSSADIASVMTVMALIYVVGILIGDMAAAAESSTRAWSLVVLIMDFLLVFGCPLWAQLTVICSTIISLAVLSADASADFGLLRSFMLGDDRPVPPTCDCPIPPCTTEALPTARLWLLAVVILVADYIVTRGFSTKLREQLNQNRCSVQVAEHLTELLATYATDAARRVVNEKGATLPERLCESYAQLLSNLDAYRVYLPDSVLLPADDLGVNATRDKDDFLALPRDARPMVEPPGLGEESPCLAICFTDIQSSTELWESYPQGMYDALNIHNAALRDVCYACSGYEVKTIGDSFMLAFTKAMSALQFGLQAQVALLGKQWPEDLLAHPLCKKLCGAGGQLLWCGLRVRISVQCGPVRIDRNPVTHRCDYFGHVVNTAARMEAVLRKGGLVATTAAVLEEVGPKGRSDLGSPVVYDAGLRELKGVRERVQVYALCARGLAGRLSILTEGTPAVTIPSRSTSLECLPNAEYIGPGVAQQRGSRGSGSGSSSCNTVRSSLQECAIPPRRPSQTRVQMKRVSATCAAVRATLRRVAPVADRVQAFVSAVCLAADMSAGVVDSVISSLVIVSWNTSRICAEHAAACRKFIVAPFRAPCHLGVATGGALTGNVAAGRRRFATVVGACVDLAAALAEEAECCGDRVLATGHVALECAAAGNAFRAQLWAPIGELGAQPIEVWEIDLDLEQNDEKWNLSASEGRNEPQEGAVWGERVSAWFRAACSAGVGTDEYARTLADVRGMCDSDAGHRLALRIESGTARTRPMPPLWAPDSDE